MTVAETLEDWLRGIKHQEFSRDRLSRKYLVHTEYCYDCLECSVRYTPANRLYT